MTRALPQPGSGASGHGDRNAARAGTPGADTADLVAFRPAPTAASASGAAEPWAGKPGTDAGKPGTDAGKPGTDAGAPDTRAGEFDTRAAERRGAGRSALRTWPVDPPAGRRVLASYVVIFALLVGIGMLLVHVLGDTALVRMDVRVARWFEARRTPSRNELGQIGAGLADAYTLTPGVIVLCAIFVAAWRRWHDVVMLGGSLLLEKALFLPMTLLVGRRRPPVPQLDGSPPTSSYPSGHVAAATVAYVALAIIIAWHVRNRLVRAAFIALAVLAPTAVAIARLHLGMHHVTDVVVGALSGATCLLVVHHALARTAARAAQRPDVPERARRLDLTAPAPSLHAHDDVAIGAPAMSAADGGVAR